MPNRYDQKFARSILLLFFVALLNHSISQTFQRSFGGTGTDVATCIKSTLDSNYIISGITSSFSNGDDDACLIKIDPAGNLLWSKSYGGQYKDRVYNVSTCSDGGFILTGYTTAGTNSYMDLLLLRTDSDGTLKWSRSIGGSLDDFGWYVTETDDGGFLAGGSTRSFNAGIYDGYIVKTDSAGTLLWTKVMGGTNTDQFYGMGKTNDGGYIITGSTFTNSFGSSDIWLVKINTAGDTLWTRQYGKATEDAGNTVIQTSDGGYMITGDLHLDLQAVKHNSCLLKTDSQGNMQWVKTYGSTGGREFGWDIKETGNGYLLLGSTGFFGNGGGGDMLAVRTDTSGNMKWAKAYGTSTFDDFWYSIQTPDSGTMMVGSTAGGYEIFVARADSSGNSSCNTVTIMPTVMTHVLQERRGTNITSGGTASNANFLTLTYSFTSADPCAMVPIDEGGLSVPQVLIYPNPFSESAVLSLLGDEPSSNLEIRLFDVFGREVARIPVTSRQSQITRSGLPGGVYFYRLESVTARDPGGQGRVKASGKIIIR